MKNRIHSLILISLCASMILTACSTSGIIKNGDDSTDLSESVELEPSMDHLDSRVEQTETSDTIGTEPESTPTPKPSELTGDVIEYAFNYDTLEQFLIPIAKNENDYTDGMTLSISAYPETYSNGYIIVFTSFNMTEYDPTYSYGRYTYAIRVALGRDEYEYLDKFDLLSEAYYKYIGPIYMADQSYDYFELSESDRYILYRDEGTADLKLRDKTTGDVTTIHEWTGLNDGAARGFGGVGNGGKLYDDKYVFFTLVTPDYEGAYNPFDGQSIDPISEIVKTNYVYDIETEELREFLNEYTFCDLVGDTLYLSTEPEAAGERTRYYSVDLSLRLNEDLRDEEFLNKFGADRISGMISDDGRYMVFVDSTSVEKQLTIYSYDTVTKEIKTATAASEFECDDIMYYISASEGKCIISFCLITRTDDGVPGIIADERIMIFDIT